MNRDIDVIAESPRIDAQYDAPVICGKGQPGHSGLTRPSRASYHAGPWEMQEGFSLREAGYLCGRRPIALWCTGGWE